MEQQRRFFLLNERCPASEIPKMMGRVVTNKYLPLDNYAPREPLGPGPSAKPSYNTNDIIPDILPPPSKSTSPSDLIRNTKQTGVKALLAVLFGIETTIARDTSVKLDSAEISRYTLPNPKQYFAKLVENEFYARDVEEILEDGKGVVGLARHAYLVTGFLTTKNTHWTFSSSSSSGVELSVSVPVIESAGVPMPLSVVIPGLDPEVSTSVSQTRERSQQFYVAEEEIFAVAYSVVKKKYWAPRKKDLVVGKTIVIKGPTRVRARHMAYGEESDEEVEDEDEDEEGEEGLRGFQIVDIEQVEEEDPLHCP